MVLGLIAFASMRLLFVHGTGVRLGSYTETLKIIRERAAVACPGAEVAGSFWGGEVGARLAQHGASIPDFDTARAVPAVAVISPDQAALALWGLLYEDPLIECRLLLAQAPPSPVFGGAPKPNQTLLARLAGPWNTPETAVILTALGEEHYGVFTAATKWLVGQVDFRELVARPVDIHELGEAAARAVVAEMVVTATERGELIRFGLDAEARDTLALALSEYLAGKHRSLVTSIAGKILKPVVGLILRPPTWLAAAKRGQWMDAASPAAGDVLLYQARGSAIRQYIRNSIAKENPTVVLAHSLGGVACVDLFIEQAIPGVKLLVTAGSQAPFFYEINALQALAFQESSAVAGRLPAHFPKWLNFYDRQDFLSFIGRGIFGERVTDEEVKSRQPFPQSHSAYWSNPQLWKSVAAKIAAL